MSKNNKNIGPKKATGTNKLQKIIKDNSKLLLGLLIGVLVMTAGIAVASKGFKSQTAEPVKSQTVPTDKSSVVETKTENKQPEASQTAPTAPSSSSQQAPKAAAATPAPAPAPACNLALKDSYTNSYNTQVSLENSIHNLWHGDGPVDSSYYAKQQGAEDARHEAKLAQLLADYQQKLASINCN